MYLFCYIRKKGVPKPIQIWVMDVSYDGDVYVGVCSYVWRSCARIEPLEGILSPLTFWKCDELLMMNSEDRQVVSYNLRTKQTRNLYEHEADGVTYSGQYVERLVSIKGGRRLVRRRRKKRALSLNFTKLILALSKIVVFQTSKK
ncbi:hypothetical protein PanWU01x14_130150 [Parasponia andersonii]|uniref:F-box associated domain-containing protein n=1 Tax=Parasponia andersonii TaxID=3476 RepID=A0A2P5CR83_PARAD|nr:hypothetical protein PanWU01x14_130150 [Parasponia andersonii]